MGRPDALIGRPGGGGIGRPEALIGGRFAPSSDDPPRWVGRIVVGPSGDTLRDGVGFGGATLERTTLGARTGGSAKGTAAGPLSVVELTLWGGCVTVAVAALDERGDAGGTVGVSRCATLVGVWSEACAASGGADDGATVTTRRRPSASARRRMRSAWASSIDADGLEAPMPSFWASPSNSLLVKPSSLESSCTRIFFGATPVPYVSCPRIRRAQFPILSQHLPSTRRSSHQRGDLVLRHGASQGT